MSKKTNSAKLSMQDWLKLVDDEIEDDNSRRGVLSTQLNAAIDIVKKNLAEIYNVPLIEIPPSIVGDMPNLPQNIGSRIAIYRDCECVLTLVAANDELEGPYTVKLGITVPEFVIEKWHRTAEIMLMSQLIDETEELILEWAMTNKKSIKAIRRK